MTGLAVAVLVGTALMVGVRPSGLPVARGRSTGRLRARLPSWRRRQPGTDVVAAVSELAALVRAGLGPASAWGHVTSGLGDDEVARRLRSAAARVGAGLSPVPSLRGQGARRQADRVLAPLAASWAVHERTGAPVADLLDTLARSLRDADDAALSRRAAMAAPVATARVLAGLPVLGLALGQLVGARPLSVLVGTGAGRVSALVGFVCVVVGALWTRRLLRSAAGTKGVRPVRSPR